MLKNKIILFFVVIFLFWLFLYQDIIGYSILQRFGWQKTTYEFSLFTGRLLILPIFLLLLNSYTKIKLRNLYTSIDRKTVIFFIILPVLILKVLPLLGLSLMSILILHKSISISLTNSFVNFTLLSINTIILGPIIEEILFRGLIFERLNKKIMTIFAVIISSFLFAFFHSGDLQLIFTFILGIILAILYQRTQNLAYPIILHMSLNLFSILNKMLVF